MVIPVNRINGYYIACRICFIFLSQQYQWGGFKGFCLAFGPNIWDLLDEETKILLKNLAINYKTNTMATQERNFGRLSPGMFFKTVFNDDDRYLVYFYNLFVPYLKEQFVSVNSNFLPVSVFHW